MVYPELQTSTSLQPLHNGNDLSVSIHRGIKPRRPSGTVKKPNPLEGIVFTGRFPIDELPPSSALVIPSAMDFADFQHMAPPRNFHSRRFHVIRIVFP